MNSWFAVLVEDGVPYRNDGERKADGYGQTYREGERTRFREPDSAHGGGPIALDVVTK